MSRQRTACAIARIVESGSGRAKPDYVVVDGKQERHVEGAYYLEWRENGRRRRLSVGKDARGAMTQQLRKEAELNARNHGVSIAPTSSNGKRSLAGAVAEYLEETKLSKKSKTDAAYSTALAYFQESCAKMNLEDIDRKDLLKFAAFLRDEKEQSPRSCWNKFSNVMTFLKAQGIRGLAMKNDWPRFVEEEPEIYDKEDLETLFVVCDAEERLWFEFFLMTRMREQEVMHTEWPDVNLTANTVRVSHKPHRGWTPRAYREREIPIPTKLATALKSWKAKANGCPLLFPATGCKPKMDFLDCLKAVAKRSQPFWE